MKRIFPVRTAVFCVVILFSLPLSAFAIGDFGGVVLNAPGTHGSKTFAARSLPTFPPEGVNAFWDSLGGKCLNGVQEVNIKQAAGVPQPPILLQFVGQYTFMKGPASHPGQLILGKYFPAMVCMMNYVFWVYCGLSLCPVTIPLPFFFAPLIIFNGSSV